MVSSSTDVWRSKGKFDQIHWNFVINPAPIGSQSSLNAGDHKELKILLKNCLIPSGFHQELRKEEKNIDFLKEIPARNAGCLIR